MLAALKCLFTDKQDNPDLPSLITLLLTIVFIYLEYHHCVTLSKDFDPQSFGTGAGAIGLGHGANKLMSNKGDYGQ